MVKKLVFVVLIVGLVLSACTPTTDSFGNTPAQAWGKVFKVIPDTGNETWNYYLGDWYAGKTCKALKDYPVGEILITICNQLTTDPKFKYMIMLDVALTPEIPGDGIVIYGVISTSEKAGRVIKSVVAMSPVLMPGAVILAQVSGAQDVLQEWIQHLTGTDIQDISRVFVSNNAPDSDLVIDPTHILQEEEGTSSAARRIETAKRIGHNNPQKCYYRPPGMVNPKTGLADPNSEAVAFGFKFRDAFKMPGGSGTNYSWGLFIHNLRAPARSTVIALAKGKEMLPGFEEIQLDDPRCQQSKTFWQELLSAIEDFIGGGPFPGAPLAPQ